MVKGKQNKTKQTHPHGAFTLVEKTNITLIGTQTQMSFQIVIVHDDK